MRETPIRRSQSGRRPRPARRWLARVVVLLTTLSGLSLGALLLGATPAAALSDAGELSARQVFDRAQPAVHRVTVEHTVQVSAPDPDLDTDRLMAAVAPTLSAQAGTREVVDRMVAEIHRDPLAYLRPAPGGYTNPVTVTTAGTGFAVTPDGHLVTSAHLVAPAPADVEAAVTEHALARIGAILAGDPAAQVAPGEQATAAQSELMAEATERFIAHHLQIGPVTTTVTVAPPAGAPGQQPSPAEIVAAGDPAGEDVAVLRVDGAVSLPTVPLGDDPAVDTGGRLYVLGHPAPATPDQPLPEEAPEPVITAARPRGAETTGGGVTVLPTGASASGGGPVLDATGAAVGIATAGPDGGTVLPAAAIREFLQQAGVTPTMSGATRTYNRGLDAFDQHRYEQALSLFRAVEDHDPDYPHAGQRITDSQTAIAQGRDETPAGGPSVPAVAGAVGLLLLAACAVASRHRRSHAPARHAHDRRPTGQPPAGRARVRFATTPPALRPSPPLPPTTWAPARTLRPAWAAPAPRPVAPGWWALPAAPEPAVKLRPAARCVRCGTRLLPAARSCTACGKGRG